MTLRHALDLQMLLSLPRDFDVSNGKCGVVDLETKALSGPTPLGDGIPAATPMEGSVTPNGWKNALVGTKVARVPMVDPKIAHSTNGLVISFLDTLVDSVTSGLKLCVVGRFVAFRPTIEMV